MLPAVCTVRDWTVRLCVHIRDSYVLPTVAYCIQQVRRAKRYCILQLQRAKRYCRHQFERFKRYCKWQAARFKRYVKNSIVRPLIRGTLFTVVTTCELVWEIALYPLLLYVSVWIKRWKHYATVQWVDPGMEYVRQHMPEKSPFCDDSDTELKDFLPPASAYGSRLASRAPSEGEEDSETGLTPLSVSNRHSTVASDDSLDEAEKEFVEGLAFPKVEGSDSVSEEDFSLRRACVKKKRVKKRKHLPAEWRHPNPPPPAAPESAVEPCSPVRSPKEPVVKGSRDLPPKTERRAKVSVGGTNKEAVVGLGILAGLMGQINNNSEDLDDIGLPQEVPSIDDEFEILDL